MSIKRDWEPLRELAEKWRKEVERIREQRLDREPGYRGWVERNMIHADELEALAPLLARKIEEARREALKDAYSVFKEAYANYDDPLIGVVRGLKAIEGKLSELEKL